MKTDNGILNLAVYGENNEFYGVTDAVLPTLSHITEAIQGAGIAGEVTAVYLGHVQAMTLVLNFRTVTRDLITFSAPKAHHIELRAGQQTFNRGRGEYEVEGMKYVFRAIPTNTNLGSAAPASSGATSLEFAINYFAAFKDGKRVFEVDPENFIYYVDGKDYLANVRRALGK